GLLELDAHHLTEPRAVPPGIEAEHADTSVVGHAQPCDHLHHGGLARPVDAEDPDALPRLDAQAHVVDRDRVAVAFAEVLGDHRRTARVVHTPTLGGPGGRPPVPEVSIAI